MSTISSPVSMSSKFTAVALLLLAQWCVTNEMKVTTDNGRPHQRPSRAEWEERQFQRSHPDIFVDTKMIPNGLEVSATLVKGKTNRYFFLVARNSSELNVQITTCSSRVTWSLMFMYEPDEDRDLLPGHSERHVSPASIPVRPESVVLKSCNRCSVVSGYRSPKTNPPAPGLYSLIFNVTRNTMVRLFASTFATPIESLHLPYVPRFKTLTVPGNKTSTTDILLDWKINPSFRKRKEMSLSYCVSVNTRGHYKAICLAQSALASYTTSSSTPSAMSPVNQGKVRERSSLFDFSFPRNINDSRKLTCFSSNKRYRFHGNFRPHQKYYFDLFAFDNITLTIVVYTGTSLTVPVTSSQPTKNVLTVNNETLSKTIHLKQNTVKRLQFGVNGTEKSIDVRVHVCIGSVLVQVSHGRKNISRFVAVGPTTRNIKFKAGVGVYTIMLRGQSLITAKDVLNAPKTSSSTVNRIPCSSVIPSRDVVVIIQISNFGRVQRDRTLTKGNVFGTAS